MFRALGGLRSYKAMILVEEELLSEDSLTL